MRKRFKEIRKWPITKHPVIRLCHVFVITRASRPCKPVERSTSAVRIPSATSEITSVQLVKSLFQGVTPFDYIKLSLQSHLGPHRLRGTGDSRTIFPRGEGSATRRLDNRLLGEGGGMGEKGAHLCTSDLSKWKGAWVRSFRG